MPPPLRPHCRGRPRPHLRQRRRLRPNRQSERQLAMAESFQRTTRRRADDPGAAARPLPDAPPLIPTTTADHPDPLPPPAPPPPAETQRPHRPPTPRPDTTQQRTGQSRAHPQVHDGPDTVATETDVAAARRRRVTCDCPAMGQPRLLPQPRHQRPRLLGRRQRRLRPASCDGRPPSARPSSRASDAASAMTTTPRVCPRSAPRVFV